VKKYYRLDKNFLIFWVHPIISIVIIIFLSGCVSTNIIPSLSNDDLEKNKESLSNIFNWKFHGRIAVKTRLDGYHGNIIWKQTGDSFQISLWGPLGLGMLSINGSSEDIEITNVNGQIIALKNVEDELQHFIGSIIPISSIQYWLLGIPNPYFSSKIESRDNSTVIDFKQSGWVIEASDFKRNIEFLLPHKIFLSNVDTDVRVAVENWEIF
jgi:outer membrane lipoprotein LolB